MLNRTTCYDMLFRIKKERRVDVSEQLDALASSRDVPQSVISFISSFDERTVDDFINVISKTKPFYSKIVFNYEDDVSKYVKALLSLLTHIKITIDKNIDLRDDLVKLFDVESISRVVTRNIMYGDNDSDIIKCAHKIKCVYLRQDELEEEKIDG